MSADFVDENNLSFSCDTINVCINELLSEHTQNKSEYYSRIVNDRFIQCNEQYMSDFDKALDNIYNAVTNDNINIRTISRVFKNLDKLSNSIYRTQLTLYKIL